MRFGGWIPQVPPSPDRNKYTRGEVGSGAHFKNTVGLGELKRQCQLYTNRTAFNETNGTKKETLVLQSVATHTKNEIEQHAWWGYGG